MSIQQIERRLPRRLSVASGAPVADVVRDGLLVQHSTGTVSAIEFLKANAIDSGVIARVLSGSALRGDDTVALLSTPAAFDA